MLEKINPNALLIDVREPEEYALGHITGSQNIPMSDIPHWAKTADQTQELYVYCKAGVRAEQVALYLKDEGFTKVTNLGGLEELTDLGFTISQ